MVRLRGGSMRGANAKKESNTSSHPEAKVEPKASGRKRNAKQVVDEKVEETRKVRRVDGGGDGENPSQPKDGLPKGWLPILGIEAAGAVPYKPEMLVELKNDNDPGFEGAWFIGAFAVLMKETRVVKANPRLLRVRACVLHGHHTSAARGGGGGKGRMSRNFFFFMAAMPN